MIPTGTIRFILLIIIFLVYRLVNSEPDYITQCGIPQCQIIESKQSSGAWILSINDKRMETIGYAWRLNTTKSDCFVNTTSFLDQFGFGVEYVVGVFTFLCESSSFNLHFTEDKRPFLWNVVLYLQVLSCSINMDYYNKITDTVKIYFLTVQNASVQMDYKYCDGSGVSKRQCNMWNTVDSVWLTNDPDKRQDVTLADIFQCNESFPNFKELTLEKWNLEEPESYFQEKFPNLQSFEIKSSSLSRPIRFPWTNTGQRISHDNQSMSNSEYMLSHYTSAFHIDKNKYYHRRILNFDSNNITDLSEFQFNGSLQMIQIANNNLQKFSQNTFKGIKGLQHLDLGKNELKDIPPKSFEYLKDLKHLDFDSNQITELRNGLFETNSELVYLDFSNNSIQTIGNNVLRNLNKLEDINLQYNNIISFIDVKLPLYSLKFRSMVLDGNPFEQFPVNIFYLRSLHIASLKGTNVKFENFTEMVLRLDFSVMADNLIESSTINDKVAKIDPERVRIIDLSRSKVQGFNLKYYGSQVERKESSMKLTRRLSLILRYFKWILDDSPIKCDCKINEMNRFIRGMVNNSELTGKESMFTDWKCKWPKELSGKRLLSIPQSETYCVSNVSGCPGNCTCFERSVSKVTIVDCRNMHFLSLPKLLPKGIIDLWFQDNNISTIDNRPYLPRIRHFILSRNELVKLNSVALKSMTNLKYFKLNSNYLVSLPQEIKSMHVDTIFLKNNPFKCDCNTVWMKSWLVSSSFVMDVADITCNVDDENEKGRKFTSVSDDDFICLEDFDSIKHVVAPAVACSNVIFLLIIAICLIYVYRLEVKVLMYIYFGIHPFDQDEKDGKESIDVLIVHAPEITDWVMTNIVKYLEFQKDYYVVCEMMRDFVAGFSYQENIASMVKHSKRMILVLSPELLEDDILKVAWNEAQEKIKELRTNYAIVVCHGVTVKQINNKDLHRYVKRGRYVDTKRGLFHQKLLYSMPQYKDISKKPKSLPDIKYCVQAMYGDDEINKQLFERHAFVSYADSEVGFIMNDLSPILQDNGYNLCLPDRDFIPGASKEENVLKAIESCLHTVFLLSGNHLQDEWSVFTFRSASEKSLRYKSNHLIVILGRDTDMNSMDEEVKFYVKTHVTLRVDEKWFLKKLLNSLPNVDDHIPYLINNETNFVEFQFCNNNTTVEIESYHKQNGFSKCQNGTNVNNGNVMYEVAYENCMFDGDDDNVKIEILEEVHCDKNNLVLVLSDNMHEIEDGDEGGSNESGDDEQEVCCECNRENYKTAENVALEECREAAVSENNVDVDTGIKNQVKMTL